MKPPISVIAATRRFLASLFEASTFEAEKGMILFLLSTALRFSSVTSSPSPYSLSLFLIRGVDSLLGSNFYGDASSNISGLRLLALVFDERTSWSILSDGQETFSSSSFPYRLFDSFPLDFAATYLYLSTISFDLCSLSIPRGSSCNAAHSKIIRIWFPDLVRIGLFRGQIMIQWRMTRKRKRIFLKCIYESPVEWMNKRKILRLQSNGLRYRY